MPTQQERLTEIQQRSQKIIQNSIQINTKIESAIETKKRLEAVLEEKYGTSDPVKIEEMIKEWEAENEKQLKEAEDQLNSLEKENEEKTNLIKQIQQGQ